MALEALPAHGMSILGTTAAHDPGTFDVPPGSKVVRFLSHETILRRATCVVCHGGLGITQKALTAEVPVVVVPYGRDQAETARRVELAKAGVRLCTRPSDSRAARRRRPIGDGLPRGRPTCESRLRHGRGTGGGGSAIEAVGRGQPLLGEG